MTDPEPVVLLHGLGRTRLAMVPVARFLRRRGYAPLNVGYFGPAGLERSLRRVARTLAERLAPYKDRPVHFVTHSMGGIVARSYLTAAGHAPGGRLVQLAPPNQGAAIADAVRRVPLVARVPALRDLGRGPQSRPRDLPQVTTHEVGVVAARSFGPWHPEPNDGVVRVAETHLPEARDWILLEHFHTVVMAAQDTLENVEAFLRTGRFRDDAPRLELDGGGGVRVSSAARGSLSLQEDR